jgi:hypothetical protein
MPDNPISAEEPYTQGLLDARRAFAQAWADVVGDSIHEADFTADYFRHQIGARLLERRTLADGVPPVVGLRVVTIREVAVRWGLAHAHDEDVHEITSLLSGVVDLVECGPRQIGVGMLRVAPFGSEVTCSGCLGWHARLARWRLDAEVDRQAAVQAANTREVECRRVAEQERDLAKRSSAMWRETVRCWIVDILGTPVSVDDIDSWPLKEMQVRLRELRAREMTEKKIEATARLATRHLFGSEHHEDARAAVAIAIREAIEEER